MYYVDIRLASGAVSRMERKLLLPGLSYPYIGRQYAVESPFDINEGDILPREKIDHLAEGMDAGIRPSGAVDLYRVIDDPFDSPPYDLLYGHPVRLTLPSVVIGAFIFNDQGYIFRIVRFHYDPGIDAKKRGRSRYGLISVFRSPGFLLSLPVFQGKRFWRETMAYYFLFSAHPCLPRPHGPLWPFLFPLASRKALQLPS